MTAVDVKQLPERTDVTKQLRKDGKKTRKYQI